jgi:DNA-binding NarL/FixJ family response regulator
MIAVLDDLPVFRLLAKRRINQQQRVLLPYIDPQVQTFVSVPELISALDSPNSFVCQLILLDYTFANGETIVKSLARIINHPRFQHTFVIGWSRKVESAREFRHYGADGFISKDRDASLVDDMIYIIKRHQENINWVELI